MLQTGGPTSAPGRYLCARLGVLLPSVAGRWPTPTSPPRSVGGNRLLQKSMCGFAMTGMPRTLGAQGGLAPPGKPYLDESHLIRAPLISFATKRMSANFLRPKNIGLWIVLVTSARSYTTESTRLVRRMPLSPESEARLLLPSLPLHKVWGVRLFPLLARFLLPSLPLHRLWGVRLFPFLVIADRTSVLAVACVSKMMLCMW